MLRPLSIAIALAATAGLSHALAQQPAPPADQEAQPPAQQSPAQQPDAQVPQIEVTDSDLDTFATIYVDLQEKVEAFEAQLAEAESQEEAQELQMEMREDSLDAIEEQGWSPEKFNQVAQAINADPNLSERAVALIQEKS